MLGKKIHENWTNSLEGTGFEMFQDYCDRRAILIWQSRDQFLKIAIHKSIKVCEAQFVFRLIVTQTIHLINILVAINTDISVWIIEL